jgi:tetratricopeptide (TPR) repeat protein
MSLSKLQLAALALCLAIHAGPAFAEDAPKNDDKKTTDNVTGEDPLKGGITIEDSPWGRNYKAGLKALQDRNFDLAEKKLQAAIEESKKNGREDKRLYQARLAMAEVYIKKLKYDDAEWLYNKVLTQGSQFFGKDSAESAQAADGLARIYTDEQKWKKAEAICKQSLDLRQKLLGPNHADTAKSIYTKARLLDKQGFYDDAEPLYKQAMTTMVASPDRDDLVVADLLRDEAVLYQKLGKPDQAAGLLARSMALKELAVNYDPNKPITGGVTFQWDKGSPRCKQTFDDVYTVKYMNIGGLQIASSVQNEGPRISCTVIMTNQTDRPITIGLGPIHLFAMKPKYKDLFRLTPEAIAQKIEDKAISQANWKRFMGNMQRMNIISSYSEVGTLNWAPSPYGLLPYETYTSYGVVNTSIPDIVARERLYRQADAIEAVGAARANDMRQTAMQPTTLAPGESKAGKIYFEPFTIDDSVLQVMVGNASFEFPFTSGGRL